MQFVQSGSNLTKNSGGVLENAGWLNDSKPSAIRGIYELTDTTLQYCFAQPGEKRPEHFKVAKGSRHTLVRLKRFSTGEQPIEKFLTDAQASVYKDDIGWIQSLILRDGDEASQPLLAKAVGLKQLKSVSIIRKDLAAGDFRQLNRVRTLRNLWLVSHAHTVSGFAAFKPSGPLESLGFEGKSFDDKTVPELQINGLKKLTLNKTSLSSRAIASLIEANQTLTRVNISYTNADNKVLVALAKLPHLSTLSITHSDLGDWAAADIARMKSLDGLLIQHTQLSDVGLQQLAALDRLSFLRIDGTLVSDAGLKTVAQAFPKLRSIYMRDLRGTVSMAGIRSLVDHPTLNEIHVGREFEERTRKVVTELRRRHREQAKREGL